MGIKSQRPKFVFDDSKVVPLEQFKKAQARPCPCCGQFVRPQKVNEVLSLREKEALIQDILKEQE